MTCELIDTAIPSHENTSIKVIEIEVTRTLGMHTETVPVVVGALRVINKSLEQHKEKIP